MMINIQGLDKAKVLHALWHGSRTQGMSFLGLRGPDFTLERAEEIIKDREEKIDNPNYRYYFDHVTIHVIKVIPVIGIIDLLFTIFDDLFGSFKREVRTS